MLSSNAPQVHLNYHWYTCTLEDVAKAVTPAVAIGCKAKGRLPAGNEDWREPRCAPDTIRLPVALGSTPDHHLWMVLGYDMLVKGLPCTS